MATDNVSTQQSASAASNIARRSLSIFSRRGYDAPSPVVESLAAGSISPTTATQLPMHSNSKAKKWKLRRQSDPKPSIGGTIIRLVPKEAAPSPMTPLEIEMATAPNEEILRNIGLTPEHTSPSPVEAIYFPPTPSASVSSRKMSKRVRKNSQGEIVGLWKDGKLSWDSTRLAVTESPSIERPKTSDGLQRSASTSDIKAELPKLQVVIPTSSHRMFSSIPYVSHSAVEVSQRDHDISPPSVASNASLESFQISALATPESTVECKLRRTLSIRGDRSLQEPRIDQLLRVPIHESASSSGSSSGSVSGDEENVSEISSHRSSITSIESMPHIELESDHEKAEDHNDAPTSPIQESKEPEDNQQTDSRKEEHPRLLDLIHIVRTPSTQKPHRRNRSFSSGHVRKLRTLPEANEEKDDAPEPSPTLSEAERELERHLSTLSDADIEIHLSRQFSVVRKPLPPPKSEKRLSLRRESRFTPEEPESPPNPPKPQTPQTPQTPKEGFLARSNSVRSTLSLILEEEDQQISSEDAELVIFYILKNTTDLDDLFNMSIINRGFYRVFRRHELELMQTVLRTMSPAAWEFRMTAIPGDEDDSAAPNPEYTPATFFEGYMRDSHTIASIKHLILERCQSILRPETVKALQAPHKACRTSRVDDALFRIWTFCILFGCQKGREDDIATQMDWLRGGIEAHQFNAQSSFSATDSLFMNSCLLICSEHFALGNKGGLSAEELYDMTELWNCLRTISQGVIGKTEHARQFGVFDDTEVRGGDIDGEEMMLGQFHNHNAFHKHLLMDSIEEWHNYLLTLGLPVIFEVSDSATSLLAFTVARRNRWTSWIPPTNGTSRSHFLREAVSRLYEERICEAFSPALSISDSIRDMRRKRGESLAIELKKRRASLSPETPFTEEILMSRANTVIERLSSGPSSAQSTPYAEIHPAFQFSLSHSPPPASPNSLYAASHAPSSPTRAAPAPPSEHGLGLTLSPPPPNITVLGTDGLAILPATVYRPPPPASRTPPVNRAPSTSPSLPTPQAAPVYRPASQHPFQIAMQSTDPAVHSPEKAIFRIVEMGFTAEEAKGALKITDMGDGLRVDRAVEYLLRQQEVY
jgi:hypothetical protein